MNNKQPKDPLYPRGFDDNNEFRKQISKQENFSKPKEKNELSLLKSLNHKIGVYLSPNSTEISENEKKKKIGVIITTLILITLIMSAYYFVIYEPSQEELSFIKTSKLNELHDLYKGPLTTSVNAVNLENEIKNANSPQELENINLLIPATKDWKSFHKKSIYKNQDNYNRTMVTYENETKDMIIPINDAITIVNENDAKILSNIKFEKPNTVSVPVLISRLQAGAGLIQVGSIVDIYTNNNDTNITSNTNPDISGCTVLAIMRYEENGKIDSEYSKSNLKVNGNETNPNEKTKGFSSNVLELIKASMLNGYNEDKTIELLKNYGIKLSNYERQINLGDLDAQYMLLIETPNDKVNYMLNNMDKIVLTIPTTHAPEWMINEINS
ncbi:hypothetical protein MBORA_19240 [Methanobrevibacter oralis]|uniref:Flp pilus assembly protein RcpC/CpaB domain-containing protein n=3 Tax=Methanobrevibacter oralis TaxID=66851 RepID=A0A165Z3N2_METOA|nr:hypothetical protein MBORA_19240 [Methanobrevibacter oralis]